MFDGFHSPLQVKVVQRAKRYVECEYLPKLDTPSLRASYASLTKLACLKLRQLGSLEVLWRPRQGGPTKNSKVSAAN